MQMSCTPALFTALNTVDCNAATHVQGVVVPNADHWLMEERIATTVGLIDKVLSDAR